MKPTRFEAFDWDLTECRRDRSKASASHAIELRLVARVGHRLCVAPN